MKHISDLFSKYKKTLTPPQASIIKEFVVVCEAVSGYKIKPEQCSYTTTTRTIHLNIPSLLKSEVLLQKTNILKKLKTNLGKNSPNNIL